METVSSVKFRRVDWPTPTNPSFRFVTQVAPRCVLLKRYAETESKSSPKNAMTETWLTGTVRMNGLIKVLKVWPAGEPPPLTCALDFIKRLFGHVHEGIGCQWRSTLFALGP